MVVCRESHAVEESPPLFIELHQLVHSCGHIIKQRIHDRDRSHRFYNDYSTGTDDRVMSATDRYIDIFTGFVDRFLRAGYRWRCLEMAGE